MRKQRIQLSNSSTDVSERNFEIREKFLAIKSCFSFDANARKITTRGDALTIGTRSRTAVVRLRKLNEVNKIDFHLQNLLFLRNFNLIFFWFSLKFCWWTKRHLRTWMNLSGSWLNPFHEESKVSLPSENEQDLLSSQENISTQDNFRKKVFLFLSQTFL